MCGGGGGGGGTDASVIEAQRRQRIADATNAINNTFARGRREALYNEQRKNVYDRNMQEYARQEADARKQLRFELARNGLSGGQQEIDALGRLGENLNNAKLKVADFADQAANQLRSSDESARLRLISQAQTGMDANTAAQNAMNQLSVNANNASSFNELATIGDLFAGIGLMRNQANAAAAKTAAQKLYSQDGYNSFYDNQGSGSYGGTVIKNGR